MMENDSVALQPVFEALRNALLPLDTSLPAVPLQASVNVPKEVFEWLRNLGNHLESLVGKEKTSQLSITNVERLLKQAEHRQKTDEENISRLESELSAALDRTSALESEKGKERSVLNEANRQIEGLQADLAMARSRLDRCEVEKLELVRVLELKQGEMAGLNEQLEGLIKKQAASRQELLNKDSALEEARRQLSAAQLQATTATQQSEASRKQAEWASAELERAIAELRDYRKLKVEEISGLRADLEQAQSNVLVLEKQLVQMKAVLGEREAKIQSTLEQLLKTREEAAEKERSFLEEMNTKGRHADLYKEASEESSARIAELEDQLEEARESLRTHDERMLALQAEHNASVARLHTVLQEKEAVIASFKNQLGTSEGAGILSATASAAMATVKSGQSFSQVYSELTQCRTGLLEATQENERLKACLRDICEDIEARLPAIQADREENIRLKSTVSSLSERMLALSQERDRLHAEVNASNGEKARLSQEVRALERQVADLGLQVQGLLTGPQESFEESSSDPIDAQQVISSRLVTVQSVAELQVRNQELLRVIRELADRAELAEAQARAQQDASAVHAQLQQALEEISQLREARSKQTALVEGLVARSSSHMANGLESSSTAIDLTSAPSEAGDDRRASLSTEHDVGLYKRLEESQTECLTVKAALLKVQAKAEFCQERLDLLKTNYDSCRQELEQYRNMSAEQGKSVVRLQNELQGMLNEVMTAREEARRAESDLALAKTTLSVSQATERRLATDKDELQAEKQKLSSLLSGLQAMIAESEASSTMLRERLTTQVEFLERELQAARRKLEDAVEAQRLETAALNRENRELNEKTKGLLEEVANLRKEVSTSAALRNEAKSAASIENRNGDEALRNLYEATERSLMEVSQAYDEYRGQAETRLGELESLLSQHQNELGSVRAQFAAAETSWSNERQSLQGRLDELAELEAMLKENEGLRSQDLTHLHSLLTETQKHLEQEQEARRAAEEQLHSVQADLRSAQNQLDALNTSLNRAQQSGSQRETELGERIKDAEAAAQRASERAVELEALLASRLEPAASGTTSNDEMSTYLRKQKDALQAELQAIQSENRRLGAQLDQTRAVLDETRARLEEAQQQPAQLQSQLAQACEEFQSRIASLSALKETNVDLAAQVEALQSRLAAAEHAKAQASNEAESAIGQLRQARAAESTHAEHLRILTEERDNWKARCMQGGGSIMDEAEKERLEQAAKEANEERDSLMDRQATLEAKMKRVLQQCHVFKNQSDDYKRKLDAIEAAGPAASSPEVEQQLAALQAELAEARQAVSEAEKQRQDLSTRLERYSLALQRCNAMKQQFDALQTENAQLKASAGNVEEIKREHELHKTLVAKQWQSRVDRLQLQVDALQAQLSASKSQTPHETEPVAKRPRETETVEPELVTVASEGDAEMEEIMDEEIGHATSEMDEAQDAEMAITQEHEVDEEHEEDEEDVEMEEDFEEEHAEEVAEPHDESVHATQDDEILRLHDEPIKTTLILPSFNLEPTSLEIPDVQLEQQQQKQVNKPTFSTADFDIDSFLVDEAMGPATKPSVVQFAKPVLATEISRTIKMPVSTTVPTSTATTSTFTPTPILPPAPQPATKGRIIDLSQTGRKPLPVPSTSTVSEQPAAPTAVARGGKLIRGGRKHKFKRGGGAPSA